MSVIVHGVPGQSLRQDGSARYGRAAARRGAFFETVTACALEDVLTVAPGTFHLFHDLGGFVGVAGHGYGPMTLPVNIDHLILTGAGYALVNAKGTPAGTLVVARGKKGPEGLVLRADGSTVPQPWLNSRKDYACAGIVMRLTGLPGWPVFVVAHHTDTNHESLPLARVFDYGGSVVNTHELRDGELLDSLAAVMPEVVTGPPPDPEHVAALRKYLSAPEVAPRAGHVSKWAQSPDPAGLPARAPYPWEMGA